MKFLFSEIGPKKMSKTVEVTLQPLQTFYDIGFDHQLDFIEAEVSPHFVGYDKEVEAVPVDGLPELVSHNYVIVYNGIKQMGRVQVLP